MDSSTKNESAPTQQAQTKDSVETVDETSPVAETPSEPPKTENEAMLLALQADIRALRDTLNKEKEQKEEAERKLAEEVETKSKLDNIVSEVRQRESSKHEKDFQDNILPYLDAIKKHKPDVEGALNNVSSRINSSIKETGFVGADVTADEQMYQVLTACASAQKINNSTLAKILKNEAEWGEKMQEKDKQLSASQEEVDKLRIELEKLSKDNTNPVNHFNTSVPKEVEQPTITDAPVVPVVAHSEKASKAPSDSLFDMTPNNNWRSLWRNA